MNRAASENTGKGCGLLFGLGWTAFSAIFVAVGLSQMWKTAVTWSWEEVPCTIERFEILAEQNEKPPFRVDLVFNYDYGGEFRQGNQLWVDHKGERDYEKLAELRAEILIGPEGPLEEAGGLHSTCRVNPDDPAVAVLLPASGSRIGFGLIFAIFGGCFMLVGIGIAISSLRKSKTNRARSSTAAADGKEAAGLLTVGFFGVFALAGLGMFGGLIIPKGLEYFSMQQWESRPAEIVWSRVTSHQGDDGTTYSVDLFYRYDYQARQYLSNRYDVLGGSSSGRDGKQKVVAAHPAGSELTVYVNPDKPWQAVVKRDLGWWALFALFPLPFLLVGVGGLWSYFRKKKPEPDQDVAVIRDLDDESELVRGTELGSSRGKRWLGFIGALLLAAFWNGIISFLIWEVWEGWSKGEPNWFLSLFAIPFLLVGLGLLVNVPYRLLAVFSPVFRLKIEDGRLTPGSRLGFSWRRNGGSGSPRRLSLWLVGVEEATYQRGTSTTTAKELFHEQSLFETDSSLMMQRGECEIRIPKTGVPSFGKKNNKIRWYLRLLAEVPMRPDLREDYEIRVSAYKRKEIS